MESENIYELLYMAHLNDQYAMAALYEQFTGMFKSIVKNAVSAYSIPMESYWDDVLQEVSMTLYDAIERYRDDQDTAFITFLCVLARRKASNVCRRLARPYTRFGDIMSLDGKIGEDNGYSVVEQTDRMNDPVYAMYYHDAEERLRKVLETLSPKELDALQAWLNSESYEDGAKRNGISYKAWDGRRHRVRKKIHQAVFDDDSDK